MAYPTVSAPYGFKPINSVDGKPYAGATRQLLISANSDPLFYGDLVCLLDTADAGTGARLARISAVYGTPYAVGVFVGCTYTNPTTKQPTWSQSWPGATAAPDAVAYVVDDPMALFQVVVTAALIPSGDEVSSASYGYIGVNVSPVLSYNGDAGNTNTGDSYMSVTTLSAGSTFGIRVIDVVPATKTASGYPELLVKIQPHAYVSDHSGTAPV